MRVINLQQCGRIFREAYYIERLYQFGCLKVFFYYVCACVRERSRLMLVGFRLVCTNKRRRDQYNHLEGRNEL